jgi:hypothetical protein
MGACRNPQKCTYILLGTFMQAYKSQINGLALLIVSDKFNVDV